MTIFLGDYTAEFMRMPGRGRGPDKKPRKRKGRLGSDALQVGSMTGAGVGLGFAGVGAAPIRSKTVDRALASKKMNRIPVLGKRIRAMAINQQAGYDKLARKSGQYLAANLPAQTAAGWVGGAAGAAYGLNYVRRQRKQARLAAGRR